MTTEIGPAEHANNLRRKVELIAFDDRRVPPSYITWFLRWTLARHRLIFVSPAGVRLTRVLTQGQLTNLTLVDPGDLKTAESDIDAFRKRFVNLSTNPATFERPCFERWILANHLARSSDATHICLIDTDQLLSVSPDRLIDAIASASEVPARYAVSGDRRRPLSDERFCIMQPVIVTQEALEGFSSFLVRDYFGIQWMQSHREWFASWTSEAQMGGVNDMLALGDFMMSSGQAFSALNDLPSPVLPPLISEFNEHYGAHNWRLVSSDRPPFLELDVGGIGTPIVGVHFHAHTKLAMEPFVRQGFLDTGTLSDALVDRRGLPRRAVSAIAVGLFGRDAVQRLRK